MRHIAIKRWTICLTILFVLFSPALAEASLGSKYYGNTYPLAPGVTLTKENFENGNTRRAINYMVADPKVDSVSFQIAYGEPLHNLTTVTQFAHREVNAGKSVVGSTNASFFIWNQSGGGGVPANLVVENNEILRFGRLSRTINEPIYHRYAFGITENNIPMIDSYKEDMRVHFSGKSVPIHLINTVREPNAVVLFTPSLGYKVPMIDSNDSTEIYVSNASQDTNKLSFGDTVTGTVTKVSRNNRGAGDHIPADGFVIAANGKELGNQLANIQVGDTISYSLSIDDKWMNNKSMIASGPLLVRDGKVAISMANSHFAKTRHARTAAGITKDNKLILVTVDGGSSGYSSGMSLHELANYLISLGADRAINFDGGGSTAMVARLAGQQYPYLVNRPLYGDERKVTNALQVISTNPYTTVTESTVGLESFVHRGNWREAAINGSAHIALSSTSEPNKGGQAAKLTYDFVSKKAPGTSAAYLVAKQPILLNGSPKKIGMWAYGDGRENWLRAELIDRNQKPHYVSFTDENKFNWYGWGYVTADIPAGVDGPLSLSKIYVAQTKDNKKAKGTVYFDEIEAIYDENYSYPAPPLFRDVNDEHWAISEIKSLVEKEVINGFPNGTFKPGDSVTREQVATMIVRQLQLNTNNRENPNYKDVTKNYAYDAIATVTELGIMTGRRAGYFDPEATLMRAEAATILQRAYELSGGESLSFPDVSPNFWAYEEILALAANDIATGYPDGTFAPEKSVTRAEFATFLHRASK